MKVDKMSISLDPQLSEAVRVAAKRAGIPLSAWMAEAAAAQLRKEAFAEFVRGFEAEHGPISDEDIRAARAELGIREA